MSSSSTGSTPDQGHRRRRPFGDRGDARTKTLAVLVGTMIVAAVIALLFVAFDGSSSGASDRNAGSKPAADRSSSTSRTAPASSSVSTPSPSAPASTSVTSPSGTASRPAGTSSPTATSAPSSHAKSSPVAHQSSTGTHRKAPKHIVYTVKKGDNLTVIAAWFHEHGYGKIYDRNRSVIGRNPNLIFPGQKIVVSGGSMSMGT